MAKKKTQKLNFYTEQSPAGRWVGHCKQHPYWTYMGALGTGRDAALSGVKRLVERELKIARSSKIKSQKTTKAPTKRKVNRFAFVVDRSGSMNGVISKALEALNKNIQTIVEESKKTGQESYVSVVSFDDRITEVNRNVPANLVGRVGGSSFTPRGMTALWDAVGTAITALESQPVAADEDVSYLVITLTDGAENCSRSFNLTSLRELMLRVQATDRWTLNFLLPPGSKSQFVSNTGIPEGNVTEWEASTRGVEQYQLQNSIGLSSYFSGRSVGVNSTKTFYTNVANVSAKKVKSQLDDLSSKVRILTVDRETPIKEFVEDTLGVYVPGSAYYQLTKDEKKIQGYKQLLVMEKGSRKVYGGDDARQVLGIPDGDLKVKPGNHGNWDIFVQSNSLNRKLVRGTKVLVDVTVSAPTPTYHPSTQARARRKY